MMDKRKCSEFVDSQSNLSVRVNANNRYGDNDFSSWLIRHLKVRQGEHVLDVGCGDGNHLRRIASIVKREKCCFGIDYDQGMIKKAQAASKSFTPSLTFMTMDMDTVGSPQSPLQNDFFNLIYSAYAFYYSKNPTRTLDELAKKLKPSGRIAIVGPYKDNNKDWFELLNKFMKLPPSVMVSSTTFMDGIHAYATKHFTSVHSFEFVNNITIPTLQDLRDYWISNIYYDAKYDAGFEKYAKEHFTTHNNFTYFKKAQMVLMQGKK